MKNALKAAALLAVFASCSANAAKFDFSYTFNDSSVITGSLLGDINGAYVENISDLHVFFNGVEYSGAPLYAAAWNTSTGAWDNSTQAKISTNAALNNFIFADANVPTDFGVSNYFYFINDASLGHEAFATNINTNQIALDNPTNASWSLTPVSSVPLPAPLLLLSSGLSLIGAMSRRRKS